jgi:hypothetical protein
VADNLGADLHQPLAQRGYRPLRHLGRQRQCAPEVGEVIGQRMKLQPNGIGGEAMARQPRPGDGVFAFLT